jgi:hypothetical protein
MTKLLRRSLGGVPLAIAALAFSPVAESAGASKGSTEGAHFFPDTSASVNDLGALVVHIDEAGVGTSEIKYTLTANAKAIYACINGGENHPKAANKEEKVGQVSSSGSFQAEHGRVEANMPPTGPLSPGSFTCPSGQKLVLAAVTYTNIVLTDLKDKVTDELGSVSRTFLKL